jgi:hypothetical protein
MHLSQLSQDWTAAALETPPLRALFHEALQARSRQSVAGDAAVDESPGRVLFTRAQLAIRLVSQLVATRCNLPRSSSLSLAAHAGNEGEYPEHALSYARTA